MIDRHLTSDRERGKEREREDREKGDFRERERKERLDRNMCWLFTY